MRLAVARVTENPALRQCRAHLQIKPATIGEIARSVRFLYPHCRKPVYFSGQPPYPLSYPHNASGLGWMTLDLVGHQARSHRGETIATGLPWTSLEGCWRRERDSNPRYPDGYNRFRVCRNRPLCHLSAVGHERGILSGADAFLTAHVAA